MKMWLGLLLAWVALSGAARAGEIPALVTAKSPVRLWVDQIGYRPSSRKLIVVASDSALPAGLKIELRDGKSGETVWSLKDKPEALKVFNGGKKDGESGDFISHLDLSFFDKPGRYFVAVENGAVTQRSCQFNIAEGVYRDTALATWKAFYYQRADCEKPEKFAGLWSHGLTHLGPEQAKEAKLYKWTGGQHFDPVGKEIADPTPYDVRGGWWDAGDFNKYTGNTVRCHNDLLLALQLLGNVAQDNQLTIPESGNGVPDELDEIRYATEYLIKIVNKEGATFGKVHELGGSPPESVTTPVQLAAPTSAATMSRAAALAYAAVVWREFKQDETFAQKCQDEALKSWKVLLDKPHPWPVDPKDSKKMQYTGDWFSLNYEQMRTLAAAALFSLTGKDEYHAIVKENAAKWKAFTPGDEGDLYPIIWLYAHTKGADAALVAQLKKLITGAADTAVNWSGEKRGYASGVKGYWWGSNSLVSRTAVPCLMAAEWSDDAEAKKKYLAAAEEYLHYLLGRNAIGKCFLSNMKALGAENSIMVMFHSWVGKDNDKFSAKYVGEGEGKIGPFPGMLVGGVNGGMKRYVQGLNWQAAPWEFNEPDITYQSPCATLLGYFGLKMK